MRLNEEHLAAARAGVIIYRPTDLRDDIRRHGLKFRLSIEAYAREAIEVARTSQMVLVKRYKDAEQFWLFGNRGSVVMDPDGTIRGYYFHRDAAHAARQMLEKGEWRPLKD